MGKSLIIPGADFSANAIERINKQYFFIEGSIVPESSDMKMTNTSYLSSANLNQALSGRTVNIIKIQKGSAGTLSFDVVKTPVIGQTSLVSGKHSEVRISADFDVPTEFTFNPITLDSDECLVVSCDGYGTVYCTNQSSVIGTSECYYSSSMETIDFVNTGVVAFGFDLGYTNLN